MKKELIVGILLTTIIAGLIGFYGGRYYERQTFRKNIQDRTNTSQFPNRFVPGEGRQRPEGFNPETRREIPNQEQQ